MRVYVGGGGGGVMKIDQMTAILNIQKLCLPTFGQLYCSLYFNQSPYSRKKGSRTMVMETNNRLVSSRL